MAISDEISRLQTAKADLKTAIEGKGVTVPSSAKLDAYPALVESIQAGGGGDDSWYLISSPNNTCYMYVKTNDTTWTMGTPYSINLFVSNAGVYFLYKGEKYYATDIIEGNNPLSKSGQPINTPTETSMFDRANITKDASGNFTAYFRVD